MSYLALARKWRPNSFNNVIGQKHVVQALKNSLNSGRIHHAWMFSGTRGIGKTTFARILAKALNCEIGITSDPCCKCRSCLEIDAGCFIDYIELDAASNRGVDEMTNLLDNAIYYPVKGRFKVYVIDEAHMLTTYAFNAMLKILEEPPAYVKFILATTEHNKIPITISSRCLHFHLRPIPIRLMMDFLEDIFSKEKINFEHEVLNILARSGNGSLRDTLSISDQVISYAGDNKLTKTMLYDLLGLVNNDIVINLLKALLEINSYEILNIGSEILSRSISFHSVLSTLATLISRVTILKETLIDFEDEIFSVEELNFFSSDVISTDMLQLFYTVLINSIDELFIAPDEFSGFIMICFRILSLIKSNKKETIKLLNNSLIKEQTNNSSTIKFDINNDKKNISLSSITIENWPFIVNNLPLNGLVAELAKQSEFVSLNDNNITLKTNIRTIANKESISKLELSLSKFLNCNIKLNIIFGDVNLTVSSIHKSDVNKLLQKTEISVMKDDYVKDLISELDGEILTNSIKYINKS